MTPLTLQRTAERLRVNKMGFWDNITLLRANVVEGKIAIANDSADQVDRNVDKTQDDIIRAEFEASVRNLPKDKISDSNGNCETCGSYAEGLGNGICAKCWDYVVNFSSANSKIWPDATQYETIYQARLNLG